ncbi:hypothetical protein [Granulicella aggregans]|uniref:hypothetical protein n=1 Tax=Granulicella aggregans TaxID=474949 RepID=UPI0021DFBC58|nr:hypothetical protein [Granulicella aggregans]
MPDVPAVPAEAKPSQHSAAQSAGNAAKAVAHSVGNTMNQVMHPAPARDPEPRWPALLALIAIGGLRLALPDFLAIGPGWLVLAVIGILIVPTVIARRMSNHNMNQALGYVTNAIITLDMAWSLWLLVAALPSHKESPGQLLRSAAALWLTNILVFASWYWRLDGGGPNARDLRGAHTDGAFLFPQMTLAPDARRAMGEDAWSPGFIDYLFIAFNTSTAFSPTDCPVLSRWAKVLMMIQAIISFATVVLLAARAVNIL